MASSEFKQIPSNNGFYAVIRDTLYIYPMADIKRALSNVSVQYTFDDNMLIANSFNDLQTIYTEMVNQTLSANYSIAVGSILQDMGHYIYFKVPNGTTYIKMRRVKLLKMGPGGANCPLDTVGYANVWTTYGDLATTYTDPVRLVRLG